MSSPGEVALLSTWDYVVIVIVLLVSTVIGIFYALTGDKHRTARDFLLADRNMKPLPVAASLMTTFISAITVLGIPAEVYRYGTMFWLMTFSVILSAVIISRTFMAIFFEHDITSVNEYLERRFNKCVRLISTTISGFHQVMYMGIVIYAPALALNAVTGLNIWVSILSTGTICTFYTSIGGLKAVVWTDAFQACIMTAGLLAVIIQGSIKRGGLREVWRIAESRGRIDFWDFNTDPTIRHTFWCLVVGQTFPWTKAYGLGQAQVQRYLSCGSQSTAQIALGLAIFGMATFLSITCLAGVVMFAYYADCDPYTMGYVTAYDQLLPYFVMDLFGERPGMAGLFIACIFSGALSTCSSGLNALSAIAGEDIIKSIWSDISPRRYTLVTKLLGFAFGGLAIFTSFLASQFEGVLQLTITIGGLVSGPLLGLFCLGVFFPCVNSYGAGFGTFIGIAFSAWIGIGSRLYPPYSNPLSLSTEKCWLNVTSGPHLSTANVLSFTPMDLPSSPVPVLDNEYPTIAGLYSISYAWFPAFSWCVCMVFGLLISFATGHNDPSKADVTLHRSIVDSFLCCFPGGCTDVCRCGVERHEKNLSLKFKEDGNERNTMKEVTSHTPYLNMEDTLTEL